MAQARGLLALTPIAVTMLAVAALPAAAQTRQPARAAAPPQQLQEVCADALRRAGQVESAIAARELLAAEYDIATARQHPTVELFARGGIDGNARRASSSRESDRFRTLSRSEAGLSLRWTLFDFQRSSHDITAAAARVNAGRQTSLQVAEQVLFECLSVYLEVLRRRTFLEAADTALTESRRFQARVPEVIRSGVADPGLRPLIEARVAQRVAARAQAVTQLRQAEASFQRMVGAAAQDLMEPSFEIRGFPSLGDMLQRARERSPAIAAAREQVAAARSANESADAQRFGSVTLDVEGSLGANVDGIERQRGSATALITYRLPLWDGGAASAGRRATSARISQAEAQVRIEQDGVDEVVRRSYALLVAAAEERVAGQDELKAQEDLLRLTDLRRAEVAGTSLVAGLDAVEAVANARSRLASATYAQMLAIYALSRELGTMPALVGVEAVVWDLVRQIDTQPAVRSLWEGLTERLGRLVPSFS